MRDRTPSVAMAMRLLVRFAPLSIAIVAASCGGGQTRGTPFDAAWIDDHGAAMTTFERAFRGTRVLPGADVAVGVIGKKALVGATLDGSATWTFKHDLHGRPAIAGSVVVAAGGGEIFALDAKSGRLLWSRTSGGRIRGAGDDGKTTVVSLIPTTGFGSFMLAIARDGSVVRQIEDDGAIGVPAIVGDSVFLPWEGRFLSVYDLPSGDERARLALRDPVSHAFAVGGSIFVGETSATRFDDRITRQAKAISLPKPMGGMPGDPVWMRPGTDWLNREADALDRVRLYARPTATGVDGERFAATSYRVAIGVDARSGAVVWARSNDADFLGGAAYAGGFALCDARGAVKLVDAKSGEIAKTISLGKAIDACVVQADALAAPRATGVARPLSDQIAEVVRGIDASAPPALRALGEKLGKQIGLGAAASGGRAYAE